MQNSEPLVPFGLAIIAISVAAIAVPYLRRRGDALTAWNIVLFGGILFVGIGSIAVYYGDFHWPELKWFQPTNTDIQKYLLGNTVFYTVLLVAYYVWSWPKRVVAPFLNKWPPVTLSLLMSSLVLFGAIAVATPMLGGVVFFGSLFFNVAHKALVFATVFSFCHWYRNKRQLPLLLLFLGVFALSLLDAMVLARGRRLTLSVAVAPLICMYWLHWRYLPPTRNMVRLAAALVIAIAAAGFYNAFRHYKADDREGRSFGATITAMKGVNVKETFNYMKDNAMFFFAQYCGQYSLLTIHLLENDQLEVDPLHSMKFIATYPIPRAIYPNKPELLGLTIVRDVLRMPYQTNWGLGMVATGYHEGGLATIVLYALIIVLVCRLIDDALVRQPTNPFLIGILCTSAPHFAAMIRGDYCIMLIEVSEAVVFAWALGLPARSLYGTAAVPAPRMVVPPVYPPLSGQMT